MANQATLIMWTPDPNVAAQLRDVFKMTLSRERRDQVSAQEMLAQAKKQPEMENYLVELLVGDGDATSDVRAAAGILLKNLVLRPSDSDRKYLKEHILRGLLSQDTLVRNITGNVITSLFVSSGVSGWPEALPQLLELAGSGEAALGTREAALLAVLKIVEDAKWGLGEAADYIITGLLRLPGTGPQGPAKLVALQVHCLTLFVPTKEQRLMVVLDDYLQMLFALASHASPDVRKNVCTGFLLVVEARPDKLVPHMSGVVDYCLHSVQDEDELVAMEACEFLLAVAEAPQQALGQVFRAKMPEILPVLLSKMEYLEEEQFLIAVQDERDDAREADKAEDVRPAVARLKEGHSAGKKGDNSESGGAGGSADSDDDSESDDDSDLEDLDLWNLRRCAASTLDALSIEFPDDVIHHLLPILQEKIVSPSWPVREAAILAFGAISKLCIDLAADKLPTLVPYLVDRLKDPETRVRQISCWTIAKYSLWVAAEAHDGGQYSNYFQPTFEAVVTCALDAKKLVQEAACLALAEFIEKSDVELIAYYVGPLVNHFARCFAVYQRKNMMMLYDTVLTFVEKLGRAEFLSDPSHAQTLLPPLFQNWELLQDDDTALWPLLECMLVVAATMEEAFAPYAVPVYQRATKILENAIALNRQADTHPEIEAPEKDFIVTALDLVDGLVQGLKGHFAELAHTENLMHIVLLCLEDQDEDVRQLAYALCGDLAIHACKQTIEPVFGQIALCAGNEIHNYSYATFPVTNNAIWLFGEMVLRVDALLVRPVLQNMVNLLVPVLNLTDTQQLVVENAAICLGRLGLAGGAEVLSPRLPELIYLWCAQMMTVAENEEKETAFLGMLNVVQTNPDNGFGGLANQQGRKNLAVFLSCIGNYLSPPENLRSLFGNFVHSYKLLLGANWSGVVGLIDKDTRVHLQGVYGA